MQRINNVTLVEEIECQHFVLNVIHDCFECVFVVVSFVHCAFLFCIKGTAGKSKHKKLQRQQRLASNCKAGTDKVS